jgi:regulator of sirC expression with transglutaminase-like and TPR domain
VAAQIFPEDHVTLHNLGRALQRVGQHAEAVASLERAVALDPSQHAYLLPLAASYEQLSRLPDAVQAYRAFLDREPQAHDAPLIRARIGRLEQVGAPDGTVQTTSALAPGA